MIPSNNLGFIDSKADRLEVEVAGHHYIIRQSPGLLNSTREGGTTGAVLWKVTPILATWLSSRPSILADLLHDATVVVELGCGVAGLVGLVLSKLVRYYILTDQDYVQKYLNENIAANMPSSQTPGRPSKKKSKAQTGSVRKASLKTMPLDWETDSAAMVKLIIPPGASIDILLLCDCVYNEYLIASLVQTCVDICRLRSSNRGATVVLIAQQLRTDAVFQAFLESMMEDFNVWRIPEEKLAVELRSGSGYAVHLAMLKDSCAKTG